uniref:Uncharacterized protein n=1 Tax=Tetraselmis sp. GSL018 TaxID=582737 RepID=A0A061SCC9_9CHLO
MGGALGRGRGLRRQLRALVLVHGTLQGFRRADHGAAVLGPGLAARVPVAGILEREPPEQVHVLQGRRPVLEGGLGLRAVSGVDGGQPEGRAAPREDGEERSARRDLRHEVEDREVGAVRRHPAPEDAPGPREPRAHHGVEAAAVGHGAEDELGGAALEVVRVEALAHCKPELGEAPRRSLQWGRGPGGAGRRQGGGPAVVGGVLNVLQRADDADAEAPHGAQSPRPARRPLPPGVPPEDVVQAPLKALKTRMAVRVDQVLAQDLCAARRAPGGVERILQVHRGIGLCEPPVQARKAQLAAAVPQLEEPLFGGRRAAMAGTSPAEEA